MCFTLAKFTENSKTSDKLANEVQNLGSTTWFFLPKKIYLELSTPESVDICLARDSHEIADNC